MSAMEWTGNQRAAVESEEARTLVSASAGSGKTQVLVGRYLWLLDHPTDPVPPSKILAVTFTEAAAAEMRSRIHATLRDRVRANPSDRRARANLAALDGAAISTIHSFCRRVIVSEYRRLGIDPAFAILGPEEAKVLKINSIERVLDTLYGLGDARGGAFRDLVARWQDKQLDADLTKFVLETREFLASLPDPAAWLCGAAAPYREAAAGVRGGVLDRMLAGRARRHMRLAVEMMDAAARFAEAVGADERKIAEIQRRAQLCRSWLSGMGERGSGSAIDLGSAFGKNLPPDKKSKHPLKETVGKLAGKAKDLAKEAARLQDEEGRSLAVRLIARAEPDLEVLLDLLERFEAQYTAFKQERSALDFSDLEHFALRALQLRPEPEEPEYRHVLVDEFQDTNRIQDEILNRLAGKEARCALFLVGDVKQSIYRFRQAEPEVFLSRLRDYSPTAGTGRVRLPLPHNFRSRSSVLAGVNELFSRLMDTECGGVDYRDGHLLEEPPLRPHPAGAQAAGPAVEFHLYESPAAPSKENDALTEWLGLHAEAEGIAERLDELLHRKGRPESRLWDLKESRERDVEMKDIVILMRATSGRAYVLEQALRDRRIPAVSAKSGAFLETLEIRQSMAMLRAILNPLDDIPLVAALRTPAFRFCVDDLAAVRGGGERIPFWSSLQKCAASGGPVAPRAREAVARIERWRTEARLRSLPDLLSLLYEESALTEYIRGFPNGALRRGNLRRLHEIARGFERGGFRPLSEFVEFLQRLGEEEIRLDPPATDPESSDAVRILSIHQAKGIEYPVVIVADLVHEFVLDRNRRVPVARKSGLGVPCFDAERRIAMATDLVGIVREEIERETRSEEMRLLYVACTRARERLILTASRRDTARFLEPFRFGASPDPRSKNTAMSFLEWIVAALADHPDGAELRGEPAGTKAPAGETFIVRHHPLSASSATPPRHDEAADPVLARAAALLPLDSAFELDPETSRLIDAASWHAPPEGSWRRHSKASVSELKRRFDRSPLRDPGDEPAGSTFESADDAFRRRPEFLLPAEAHGAIASGRAVHAVLQRLDLAGPLDESGLASQIARFVEEGILGAEEAKQVRPAKLSAFFSTPLGLRLRRDPSRVYREVPVNVGVTPEAWEKWQRGEWVLPSQGGNEFVHVQGIIDCLIEEDEGLLLIDYKTGRARGGDLDRRALSYTPQVRAYAAAVRALIGRPVREAFLYFIDAEQARAVYLNPSTT